MKPQFKFEPVPGIYPSRHENADCTAEATVAKFCSDFDFQMSLILLLMLYFPLKMLHGLRHPGPENLGTLPVSHSRRLTMPVYSDSVHSEAVADLLSEIFRVTLSTTSSTR